MQIWEREVLEYKPSLSYARKVRALIDSLISQQQLETIPISMTFTRLMERTGHDILYNTVAALSKIRETREAIDRCLSNHPPYQEYQKVKDTDPQLAAEIIESSIRDINGKPQMDVLPVIDRLSVDMTAQIDKMNNSLFNGDADYNDLELIREEEEKQLSSLMDRELKNESVDYLIPSMRVKKLLAYEERLKTYQYAASSIDRYLLSDLKETLDHDVEPALRFIATQDQETQEVLSEVYEAGFASAADASVGGLHNILRLDDQDFRDMVDDMLIEAEKKTIKHHKILIPIMDGEESDVGVEMLKTTLQSGADTVKYGVDTLVSEHITCSSAMALRTKEYFESLASKRTNQMMHKLVEDVRREISPDFLEKDIKRFIDKNNVYAPATICG